MKITIFHITHMFYTSSYIFYMSTYSQYCKETFTSVYNYISYIVKLTNCKYLRIPEMLTAPMFEMFFCRCKRHSCFILFLVMTSSVHVMMSSVCVMMSSLPVMMSSLCVVTSSMHLPLMT